MALEVMAHDTGPIPLDLSFRVEPGELLALVGPSGSGKTTLLRTIAGLWRPAQARVVAGGAVWLDTQAGVTLPPDRRRVGVVFQSYALFPHLTAAQNVACAMGDLPRAHRLPEALRLLDLVDLGGLADRRPAQLSGGQQQRVAIARALARRPQALLLDEPFSAVDRATREGLHARIQTLRAHLAMPVVLVTHDLTEAQALADRMVVIAAGRMVAEGPTAAVLSDPAALRAVGLREAAAMLRATVLRHHPDGMSELTTATGTIWLPRVDAAPGTGLQVRIMAHDVILSRARPEGLSAQNILPVRVIDQRIGDGPAVMVRLAVGPDQLLARITRRAADQLALQPGEPAHAILKSMSVARDHIARDAG
ncbi:molybdenum ABC transporter ATP-binding protein [Paracoccus gahaiensis]|uniref:Molybdenum ABC transporter ATP-binding protein n=1 Tax=Paracoccus gahaiensis TaxID=1706839 RepID=A0A4U0RN93_9RHOB|nr:molybdenum ABC transporter ATP-binding protein [Paracoccus gahaiensis]TJZ89584.1 molybdenum ABC transporter ATP-binding protein [Paracoccus gahaiensis]